MGPRRAGSGKPTMKPAPTRGFHTESTRQCGQIEDVPRWTPGSTARGGGHPGRTSSRAPEGGPTTPFVPSPPSGVMGSKRVPGLYQVPVYAAEECVRLDIGKSRLWPAAEPLFGVLGVRVQIRTSRYGAQQPRFSAGGHRLPPPETCSGRLGHAAEGQMPPSLRFSWRHLSSCSGTCD